MDFRIQGRPCWVEISTAAFENNFQVLTASTPGVELLAIVKANAYGLGLEPLVPAAIRAGARWLGVTSVEEGVAARELADQVNANVQILVIGGVFEGQSEAAVFHRLTPVVWEHWQWQMLEEAAKAAGLGSKPFPVHLELNTGMNRQGIDANVLGPLLDRFTATNTPLGLDGLMTHLFAADESDGATTHHQMANLAELVRRIHSSGLRPSWLHVGNSAATLAGHASHGLHQICERYGMRPMLRPGLALYGVAPAFEPDMPQAVLEAQMKLRPVLEWKTRVVTVRTIEPGQVVGYNGTFVATEPMRLALLAVGYADGLKRELSNKGAVLIAGQRAPIVGRISMDQTVVDVTEMADVAPGNEAVLIGKQGSERISAEDHAAWAGTIPWEIFTSITSRVQRIEV